MNSKIFEGNDLETIKEMGASAFDLEKSKLYFKTIEEQEKGILFLKKKSIKVEVFVIEEIRDHIREYLEKLIANMGFKATIESSISDNKISFNLNSDNNALLIGKEGKNIKAIQLFIKKYLLNNYGIKIHLNIDVNDYKEKNISRLKSLARKLSREVAKTKVAATLDPMNSYERRIIHSYLSDDKYVKTESIGEEPNRQIVIKPNNK